MGFRKFICKTFEEAADNYDVVFKRIAILLFSIVVVTVFIVMVASFVYEIILPHWRGWVIGIGCVVGFFLSPYLFTIPASVFRQIKNNLKGRC